MAEEKVKEVKVPQPEADGTVYFMPCENCTIIHPVDYDKDTRKHGKHHFITVKKGVHFSTNKPHEIEALTKKGFRKVNKPKVRPKDVDDE